MLIILAICSLITFAIWVISVVDCINYIYRSQQRVVKNSFIRWLGSVWPDEPNNSLGFVLEGLGSYAVALFAFGIVYAFLSYQNSESFNVKTQLSLLEAIYFSVVTAATVGYGDLYPLSLATRLTVTAEIIISFLYLIFILSTASGLVRPTLRKASRKGEAYEDSSFGDHDDYGRR